MKFRSQIENQMSDYMLMRASSLFIYGLYVVLPWGKHFVRKHFIPSDSER